MKNADMPAKPLPLGGNGAVITIDTDFAAFAKQCHAATGITKREHFAGLAMQGLTTREGYGSPEMLAADAVAFADALLAELESNS